jgi:hypothetical protein
LYNEAYLAYSAIIQDEAQQRNWTFYEAVKDTNIPLQYARAVYNRLLDCLGFNTLP